MAHQYIMALDATERHARQIIRKHIKNRPLGRIEREHNFSPPQPVLSCRTVDIDVSGTRTYRPCSSADIIQEQHKLIHDVYLKSRENSAPPRKSRTKKNERKNLNILKTLSVDGFSTNRSASPRSAVSAPGGIGLSKRARTSKTKETPKAATESFLRLRVDLGYREKSQAFREVNKQVHDQWSDSNHALDEGKFVRGKKQQGGSSLDSKTGNQWFSFAGGFGERSSGVVDAFAARTEDDQYYNIDGLAGTQVAKQVRKGNKIIIGKNGNIPAHNLRSQAHSAEGLTFSMESLPNENYPPERVSLCWTDEVSRPESKTVAPRGPSTPRPQQSLCETKPVVFEKLIKDDTEKMRRKLIQKAEGQNRLRSQTKPRSGIDGGQYAGSRITSINLETIDHNYHRADGLTYDDIINIKTSKTNRDKEKSRGEASITSMSRKGHGQNNGSPSLINEDEETLSKAGSRRASVQSNKSTNSAKSFERNISVKINVISPLPQNTQDLVVTNINKTEPPPGRPATPVHRKGSAKSGKIVSGKPTSAASSTSISAHGPTGETSFISFTQQICVSKDHINKVSSPGSTNGLSANDVIDSVRDHNETSSEQPGTDMPSGIVLLNSKPNTPVKSSEPKTESQMEIRPTTPENSPSYDKSEYAFNIPTAEREDSEFTLHDGNPTSDKKEGTEIKAIITSNKAED